MRCDTCGRTQKVNEDFIMTKVNQNKIVVKCGECFKKK